MHNLLLPKDASGLNQWSPHIFLCLSAYLRVCEIGGHRPINSAPFSLLPVPPLRPIPPHARSLAMSKKVLHLCRLAQIWQPPPPPPRATKAFAGTMLGDEWRSTDMHPANIRINSTYVLIQTSDRGNYLMDFFFANTLKGVVVKHWYIWMYEPAIGPCGQYFLFQLAVALQGDRQLGFLCSSITDDPSHWTLPL